MKIDVGAVEELISYDLILQLKMCAISSLGGNPSRIIATSILSKVYKKRQKQTNKYV